MNYNKEILLTALRKEIGEAIADNRAKRGLKQKELAAMCGISERTLISIENGYANCSINRYLLISIALETELADLLNMGVTNLFKEQSSRERLQARIKNIREDMQLRLEAHRKNISRTAAAGRQNNGSQDAETRAKYKPKSLARGGRCARIFVSMILNLFAFRNFALQKAAE